MAFFPGTSLNFSPNRKLCTFSKEASHSEQMIQKLSRQNAYLKSQLFSLIQNTPLFDAANSHETCIYETKVNTARVFLSPTPHPLCSPPNYRGTVQFLNKGTVNKKFFSPSSSPNSRKTEQFFRMKSRSPRNTLDFYKQSMGQQKLKQKQMTINQGNFNYLRTRRSENISPNKITPQQSCIFSPNNIQRSRSPTLNFRKLKEDEEVTLSKVKRYKSPSFLKNRKSLKENIEECMQSIVSPTYNEHQFIKNQLRQQPYAKSQLSSKEDDLDDMYEQLQKYQAKIEAEKKVNDRKKQGYFNYSETGSAISIERRLREIMNYPNPA